VSASNRPDDPTTRGDGDGEGAPVEERASAGDDGIGDVEGGGGDEMPSSDEVPSDDELEGEAQTLAGLLATIKSQPTETLPVNILANVQDQLRHRSRGRYYADHWKHRFPYEAIVQAVLLVGALIIYALAVPEPPRLIPVTAETFKVAGSEVSLAARMLNDYGSFTNEHEGVDANGWKHLVGEVPNARLEDLKTELSLYPWMRLDSEDLVPPDKTRVRIAIRPGR